MNESQIIGYLHLFEKYTPTIKKESEKSKDSESKNKSYDSGHIFYALLKYVRPTQEVREKHIYCYTLSEKLFRVCREKEPNVASYFVDKILQQNCSLDPNNLLEYHSIKSILNPVLAYYYYYLNKDYDSAQKYMVELLNNIDFLIDHGFDDGMYMKIEQYLNLSKVYFNAGKYSDSAQFAREVIKYLMSNGSESFQFPFSSVLSFEGQYQSILQSFINGILSKAIGKTDTLNSLHNGYLSSIFDNLNITYNDNISSSVKDSLEIFLLILNDRLMEGLEKSIKSNIFNKQVPTTIQRFILSTLLNFQDVSQLIPLDLKRSIYSYQLNELNLSTSNIRINDFAITSTN
jgi:hypothetical protein